jgi:enoyl-[acyl-carrier-protein] reductase (NADH)
MVDDWIARSAMHRLATPDEIANTVLFLLSDLSSGITGETLTVSCGLAFP